MKKPTKINVKDARSLWGSACQELGCKKTPQYRLRYKGFELLWRARQCFLKAEDLDKKPTPPPRKDRT